MASSSSPPLRVLELFSGIGGMHFALEAAGVHAEVVAAMEVSDVANKVYRQNFPDVKVLQSNICGLTSDLLNELRVDAVLMSPPCQPFTRQGHQKDVADARTQPLLQVLRILPEVPRIKFVLVENVKGFEVSESRSLLLSALDGLGFHRREVMLSPSHLGIPNSRLRYFLVARRAGEEEEGREGGGGGGGDFSFLSSDRVFDGDDPRMREEVVAAVAATSGADYPCTIGGYLDDDEEVGGEFLVCDSTLVRYAEIFDIVESDSENCCCFTKAYGKYAEGTGSVLCQGGNVDEVYSRVRRLPPEDQEGRLRALKELRLRYFTPKEISRLMGFPARFSFPQATTVSQRYRLLGNSLNVAVVAWLLRLALKC